MTTNKKSIWMLALVALGAALTFVACGEEEVGEPADPIYPVPGVVKLTVDVVGPSGSKTPMDMVLVKGGVFMMGAPVSDSEADSTERPVHPVVISNDFYISVTEVTQEQYEVLTGGKNPSVFARGGNYPVDNVTYEEAEAFCTTLSTRDGRTFKLPTEAQWEYAARGGHFAPKPATLYAGSDVVDRVAWFVANSENKSHSVRQKAPNALGLYDMSGNLWEWCRDWYSADYYRTYFANYLDDNTVWGDVFTADTAVNPQGPDEAEYRVIRGGGWMGRTPSCRITDRDFYRPKARANYLGFRVIMEVAGN